MISLEEPPPNVVFILLCADASALLETIRSRAQLIRTKPLSDEVIFDYVRNNTKCTLSDKSLKEIILASSGSLGYVLDMLDEKKSARLLEDRGRIDEFVSILFDDSHMAYSKITSFFSMQRDAIKELLLSSLIAIRDMAVIKKDKSAKLCFYSSREELISRASKLTLSKILRAYDSVNQGIEDFNSNSNVPNTLTSILIAIQKGH